MEPEKPFACTFQDCGMTFTNEDHLHVHTKKHDMVLQLGMEQKAAFVADQTPTPTRFIRNCEEVGLFQDLQNVNPFDEGFKRAMETKHGVLSLEGPSSTEDALHTPHLVFPLESHDCTLYTANNQRNITISRSSSDESGAVKEYETTTISKLTNEVTTISRVVKDVPDKSNDEEKSTKKDIVNETVSYRNNVIKIQSNVEIRKDSNLLSVDSNKIDLPPIMSQKSIDFVVDSLTADVSNEKKPDKPNDSNSKNDFKLEECEVVIMLPNGKNVRMKAIEELDKMIDAKEKLKKVIKSKEKKENKVQNNIPNMIPISTGTLIPVTLVNAPVPVVKSIPKIPIVPLSKRKEDKEKEKREHSDNGVSKPSNCNNDSNNDSVKRQRFSDGRSAASRRYRERVKQTMQQQSEENKYLRTVNLQLKSERALLQEIIKRHLLKCPVGEDLRNIQESIHHAAQSMKQ